MWGDSCSLMRCSWPESCYSYTFSSASEYRRAPHHPPMERPWQDTMFFFLRNAMLYLLVVGVSVAIRMTGQWYRAENIRKDLERSRSEAELQNLKSQLNPHFLFNTLNNIYSLIQLDPDRAQQTVHDLSRLLRYVLYDSSRPTVPLKAEMDSWAITSS